MPFNVGDRVRAVRTIHALVTEGSEWTVTGYFEHESQDGSRINISVTAEQTRDFGFTGTNYDADYFELVVTAPEKFCVVYIDTLRSDPSQSVVKGGSVWRNRDEAIMYARRLLDVGADGTWLVPVRAVAQVFPDRVEDFIT